VRNDWLKYLTIGSAGMAQTFPIMFTQAGLPAVLRTMGMPLEAYWLFTIPLIPFWSKFMWAPLADRYGSRRFGLRRSWILPCTLGAALCLVLLAFVEPDVQALYPVIALLVLHALLLATQDVAIDAYTVENLLPHERGVGASVKIVMEAVGSLTALAGLMAVYERFGWRASVIGCAVLLTLLTLPVLLRKDASGERARASNVPPPSLFAFFKRVDSRYIAVLLLLAGLVKGVLAGMTGTFLVDAGLTLSQVGLITGGVFATGQLLGAASSGLVMQRLGPVRFAGLIAAVCMPCFAPLAILAWYGAPTLWLAAAAMLPAAVALAGLHLLVTASRFAWASQQQAGTDFSAQGAMYNLGESAMAAMAGFLAATLGWTGFFAATGMIAAVAAASIWRTNGTLSRLVAQRERQAAEGGTPL
jgi:hypothetical protein